MITLQQIKDFAAREEHNISEDIKAFVAKIEAEWGELASRPTPAPTPAPVVLTEGDAAADVAGTPRPDNSTVAPPAAPPAAIQPV